MPIRPEFLHLYRGPAWRATRERIRERAGDACERCHKPNGVTVETVVGKVLDSRKVTIAPYMFWRVPDCDVWHSDGGHIKSKPAPNPSLLMFSQTSRRTIRAKCGAAHLNHVAGDDRDENLQWLCDWCHFHHDAGHHHETRATRKDAARPILVAQEARTA